MRKVVFDISEMSDSKEIYEQRANPIFAVFIYCIVALLLVALIYSCVGEIEIVTTANGVIRPNENVNTVSSLLGGAVTEANYYDGQLVQTGDVLFAVDTSEAQIQLAGLLMLQENYRYQAEMINRFLDAIGSGVNPFSSDLRGKEYPYYTQYEDFLITLENTDLNFEYETDKVEANINTLCQKITEIEKKIAGLTSYKKSVEQGRNLTYGYPEYEKMYLLYVSDLTALENEYQSRRIQIESDYSAESNQKNLENYQKMHTEYGYLLESIHTGESVFPKDDTSDCKRMYDDYAYNLSTYEKQYKSALTVYNELIGKSTEKYDEIMLEGYTLFRQSVVNNQDMFVDSEGSAIYRELYLNYKEIYDSLDRAAISTAQAYDVLSTNPDATENEILEALDEKINAESERDEYVTSTLMSIDEMLLEIEEIISAKVQVDGAKKAIAAYQNKVLLEYGQVYSELAAKIENLRLTNLSTQSKETLLVELEKSYNSSKEQYYYQTIIKIDSSLQTLQSELMTTQSNLRQNTVTKEMYENNKGKDGEILPISSAIIEQTILLLNQLETVNAQLDELDIQIQQVEEQITQGKVRARCDGIVSTSQTMVAGDVISAGTAVATIIPMKESEYKVHLYVSNVDIGNIDIGDTVKFNILAFPSSQYGTVNGTIISISTDTLIQDGQYSGYYLVECTIQQASMRDWEGNANTVSTGMQVEAKITTQEKTILRYLLEKIDLF